MSYIITNRECTCDFKCFISELLSSFRNAQKSNLILPLSDHFITPKLLENHVIIILRTLKINTQPSITNCLITRPITSLRTIKKGNVGYNFTPRSVRKGGGGGGGSWLVYEKCGRGGGGERGSCTYAILHFYRFVWKKITA